MLHFTDIRELVNSPKPQKEQDILSAKYLSLTFRIFDLLQCFVCVFMIHCFSTTEYRGVLRRTASSSTIYNTITFTFSSVPACCLEHYKNIFLVFSKKYRQETLFLLALILKEGAILFFILPLCLSVNKVNVSVLRRASQAASSLMCKSFSDA